MNSLNNTKRRMLALLLVLVVSVFAVTPVFAKTVGDPFKERVGIAAAVMEKDALRVRAIQTTLPTGEVRYSPASSEPQASPLYPMWHYTCYFEGVKIPCEFLAWLWY